MLADVIRTSLWWSAKLISTESYVNEKYGKYPVWMNKFIIPLQQGLDEEQKKIREKLDECLIYRAMPLESIVSESGNSAPVPSRYPEFCKQNALFGLCGEGYLEEFEGKFGRCSIEKGFIGEKLTGKFGYIEQKFHNKAMIQGHMLDGMLQFKGRILTPDGDEYAGDFKDDKLHGNGTTTFADRSKYEGDFKDGDCHGSGTHYLADGSKY